MEHELAFDEFGYTAGGVLKESIVNGRPQRDAKTPGPHFADWARQKKMLMYKTND